MSLTGAYTRSEHVHAVACSVYACSVRRSLAEGASGEASMLAVRRAGHVCAVAIGHVTIELIREQDGGREMVSSAGTFAGFCCLWKGPKSVSL